MGEQQEQGFDSRRRERRLDVDVLLVRAITSVGLVASIAAVYVLVGLVARLGSDALVDSLLPELVATAIVAVAFEPTRRLLARSAERLMYGERATPLEVLSQLTAQLSNSADHGPEVLARLVAKGTGALHATVWVGSGDVVRSHSSWPADAGAVPATAHRREVARGANAAGASIRDGDDSLGMLSFVKPDGVPITSADLDLLRDVAAHSGLVLRNLSLQSELQDRADELRTSRRRLVAARDAERHRLERDLHDGAQQHVVALKVRLDIAAAMAARDAHGELATHLSQLAADCQAAIDALRATAHGLYPAVLEAEGLDRALGQLRLSENLRLQLDVGVSDRLPRRIEETLYFTVRLLVEALERAGGRHLDVAITERDGRVVLQGESDRWIDRESLTALTDRTDAADGTLTTIEVGGRHVVEIGFDLDPTPHVDLDHDQEVPA
ncbi:MAG: histidine kinase [Actinomycetota bacterium]